MSIIIIILAIISAIFLIICYFKWPTVEHYIAVLWKELGKPYMLYMLNVSIKKVILKYFLAVTTICSCNGLSKLFVTITVENKQCLFEHHFVEYDKERASEKLSKREFEGADKLAGMLLDPKTRHF